MGWQHHGKRKYFYRSARVGGKPRKFYIGSGALGQLGALLAARRRGDRQAEARAWEAHQARLAEADALMSQFRAPL